MNLLEFNERFPNEATCEQYLIQKRWPNGYVCVKCGHTKAWYMTARRTFECASCRKQYSITADTLFHKSQTPLREWFVALFLMSESKKGISGLALKRYLGAKWDERIYEMKAKIQAAMEHREARYFLEGLQEVDVAFLSQDGQKEPTLLVVSLNSRENPKFLRAKLLQTQSASQIAENLTALNPEKARFVSDGHASFRALSQQFKIEAVTMADKRDNQVILPWVHVCISNLKRFLDGTHHSVRKLSGYLAEFCWRFNRRFGNLFERGIYTALSYKPQYLPA